MYPWKETYSTSPYSSAILFSHIETKLKEEGETSFWLGDKSDVRPLVLLFPTLQIMKLRFGSSDKMPGVTQLRTGRDKIHGASLVVQWLGHLTPNAGGPGLIPGQGIRSCKLQLRPRAAK